MKSWEEVVAGKGKKCSHPRQEGKAAGMGKKQKHKEREVAGSRQCGEEVCCMPNAYVGCVAGRQGRQAC